MAIMAAVHPSPINASGLKCNLWIGFPSHGVLNSPRSRKTLCFSLQSLQSFQLTMKPELQSKIMNSQKTSWQRFNDRRVMLKASAVAELLADDNNSDGAADSLGEEAPWPQDEKRGESEKFDWNAQWYPVAVVEELDKRVPHSVTILGRDLAVWWDRNGKSWQVFDDKCPHRLAPLSEGRINEQGQLQCSYHGWSFAPCSGDCTCIPQAPPDGNPVWKSNRACATVYPSVEQQGMIWFWPDTRPDFKDIASSKLPPSIPVLSDPSFKGILSMRNLFYGYEQLVENLTDPSHVPFAHHRLQGDRNKAKPLNFKVEKIDKTGFIGKGERGPAVFTAPCIITLESELQSPKAKNESDRRALEKKVILVLICIPVSPGKSKLIWTFPRNFGLWLDYVIPRWLTHIRQMLVLDSDLYLLHLAERKLEQESHSWETACYVPATSDAFVIAFRKWLRVYGGGAPDWGAKYSGQLPPTPPKEQLMDRYWTHVILCHYCKTALRSFQFLEVLMQVVSVGIPAILAAAALKPIPYLRSWSIPLVCIAMFCALTSRWLSHFIRKTYYFHDYNHALVK